MRSTGLALQQVSAGYPDRPGVLSGADLVVTPGSRIALLGANGCGKSTLLKVLCGALEPSTGTVTWDGEPLRYSRAAMREHRRRVQLVLQDPDDQLFSADVAQDVSFGPTNMGLEADEVRERVAEALALLGISHLAERATHHLSYGERKRVATAGAVAMRPSVVLLDEPTAGLDPRGCDLVVEALERLHEHGTSLVVATHDVDMALAWADDVAVVAGGVVVQGNPAVLLADEELLAAAGLRRPFCVDVAARLGLPGAPRTVDQLVAALKGGQLYP